MSAFPTDILAEGANALGISLSAQSLEKFEQYSDMLRLWNEKLNLTAITIPQQIVEKHFLDSLAVLLALPKEPLTLIDIGSGAGFPGIPLAIARENITVTLLEATAKKGAFLHAVIEALGLKNVQVEIGRAETVAHQPKFREIFDAATARAVAQLATLAELSLPFVRIDGMVIAQKVLGSESIESASRALETLGGAFEQELTVPLPALADRRLITIRKNTATPEAYPRRPGIPAKKPL